MPALCLIDKNWKKPKSSSTGEWLRTPYYISVISIQWNTNQQQKKEAIDTCENLDKSQRIYGEQKKQNKTLTFKACTLYDTIYIIFLE